MSDAPVIYTITCVSGDPSFVPPSGVHVSLPDVHLRKMRARCWGYYFDRADAEYCIEHNETDLCEQGYYQFAVLTALGEGPLADQEELQWYEFVLNREAPPHVDVRKIEKPEKYKQFFFGL